MQHDISTIIKVLRLPLMIMVVFIHCYLYPTGEMEGFTYFERIFSRIIPSVAVPLFMFFSGFLFFIKGRNDLNLTFYKKQWIKRLKTLLIPYLLWNLIVIFAFWAMHKYLPQVINPDFENTEKFSFTQILDCFWKGSGGFPIAYQFWFIRDLILIVFLSPLIGLILKNRTWTILLFALLYFIVNKGFILMLFYFSLGACMALNQINFVKVCRKISLWTFAIWGILFIFRVCGNDNIYLKFCYVICSSASIISLNCLYRGNTFTRLMNHFSNTSFFIFASHGLLALLLCKVIERVFSFQNQMFWIFTYILNIGLIIFVCICSYYLIKLICPKILSILTGGR